MTLQRNSKVYYKQPKCKCSGGGFTENYGTIVDIIINTNNKIFYKVSTDGQGTFVVAADHILKEIQE